jgi:hypothetical protein
MAKLLWAFEILPVVDVETGSEVRVSTDPREAYCEGFLVCAYDFPARFKVRGKERELTVLREFGEAEGVFKRFEV